MLYRCEMCGRTYRSPGWLFRHVGRAHGEGATDGERPAGGLSLGAGPLFAELGREAAELREACEALGVDPGDVMSCRVYGGRVVLIEGPVGYKRVYESAAA